MRFLLGHAYEHHLVAHPTLLAQPMGHFVLALAVLEMNQRNPFVGSHDLHRLYPALGDMAQQSGRRNELAQMLGEETDQSSPVAKLGETAVPIQPVDVLNLQSDMTFKQFVNVGHDPMFYNNSNPRCQDSSV